jgi:hypothetical protein
MNQMAMCVQQNVAIVSILYLKKIAYNGVCSKAFHKTSLRVGIVVRANISKMLQEKVTKRSIVFAVPF